MKRGGEPCELHNRKGNKLLHQSLAMIHTFFLFFFPAFFLLAFSSVTFYFDAYLFHCSKNISVAETLVR